MKREYVAKVKGRRGHFHFTECDYVGKDKMRLSASNYMVGSIMCKNYGLTANIEDVTFCYIWHFSGWEKKVIKWFKKLWKR